MDRERLLLQAQEVVDSQPGLTISQHDDCILLEGKYVFDGTFEDIPFYDEFCLSIKVPWDYPYGLPEVSEVTGRVASSGYGHDFGENILCMGATCDLIDIIQSSDSLLEYLESVLSSYLYGFMYFERYGVAPPYGERSHGYRGLKEAYKDRFGVEEDLVVYQLLGLLGQGKYRGHILCPCGSGKRLRDCHGPALLRDQKSEYFPYYKHNAASIIHEAHEEMLRDREAKRRLQAAIRSGGKI